MGAPATARLARKTETKLPHVFRGELLLIDVRCKGRAVLQLSRPVKDLLTRVFNAGGGPGNRDGHFVPDCVEPGLLRSFPDLRHDIREFLVRSGKRQRAFRLDVEERIGAIGVRGMDDDVVKRVARRALLKSDSSDGRARQATGFTARKQRQEIERANLSLELGPGIACRCRRRDLWRL